MPRTTLLTFFLASQLTQFCLALTFPVSLRLSTFVSSGAKPVNCNGVSTSEQTRFAMSICPSERISSSVLGACVGDALAAPIHWYYDLDRMRSDIKNCFPMECRDDRDRLAYFCQVPSNLKHPDSWSYFKVYDPTKDPLGIVHGTEQHWTEPGAFYHGNLEKGESTTTVQMALLLTRSLVERGAYDYSDYLTRYNCPRPLSMFVRNRDRLKSWDQGTSTTSRRREPAATPTSRRTSAISSARCAAARRRIAAAFPARTV
jgi:hypothetical protein